MLLTIELPDGIKPPKFKLFERLEHEGKTMTVVSIGYYVPWSPTDAGWYYVMDPMFHLWQDAGCPDYDDTMEVPEHALKRPRKTRKAKGKAEGLTKVSEVLPEVVEAITAA